MNDKKKLIIMLVVVGLLLAGAGLVIGKTATAPSETINDYKAVPPKGAGKFDRD